LEWEVTEPDRTIDLCLRLAEVNADILNEVFRFCRLNDISISKGLAELIREARMTAQRIEDLSDLSLPLAPPESKQGDDFGLTNGEVTEPSIRYCYLFVGSSQIRGLLPYVG
jgi:hypothetical protein